MNSANNNEDIPEFQQNMFIKLNEQNNMHRQLSTKNVRRNTQTSNTKNGAGGPLVVFQLIQTADRAGSRYKINKQQQQSMNSNQAQYLPKQSQNAVRMLQVNKSVNYNNKVASRVATASKNVAGHNMNPLLQSSGAHSTNDR